MQHTDLVPSDTATLDRKNVLGIITEVGGSTSHSAIIARSYEIPAVLGVNAIVSHLEDRQEIILDAVDGVILTEFTAEDLACYEAKRAEALRRQAHTKLYIDREPVTPDGVRIAVELNIAAADHQSLSNARYTDGVGLFRSEFLYMGRNTLPTENEQFQAYQKVLMTYGNRPVILRTLDVGGDKPMNCIEMPHEDNPFLGNRALRLCFQNPEMFNTQLRQPYELPSTEICGLCFQWWPVWMISGGLRIACNEPKQNWLQKMCRSRKMSRLALW